MNSNPTTVSDPEFETESGVLTTLRELRHSPTALIGAGIISAIVVLAVFSTVDKLLFDKQLITTLIADPQGMDTTNIYAAPLSTIRWGRTSTVETCLRASSTGVASRSLLVSSLSVSPLLAALSSVLSPPTRAVTSTTR
ncbi:hypothetical protein ACFQJ8_14260 [Halocatena marina]|uniref:hypothetical protein n=1 Tax=Halocatena marina TaxID=2934937 RepID=UPI00360D5B04